MIAVQAAHAAAKAKTKVVDAFRIRGATAPERAVSLTELGLASDDRALGALITSGVVRAVDPRGRPVVIGYESSHIAGYYLDEVAYIAERDRPARGPGRRAAIVIAILLLLLVLPLLFLLVMSG